MKRDEINDAGIESLGRSQSCLRRNSKALNWLKNIKGLDQSTLDKFFLGLTEKIKNKNHHLCINALSAPIIGSDGQPKRRRIYADIKKVTINPKKSGGWSSGDPLVYYSGSICGKKNLFICDWVFDVWKLDQETRNTVGFGDFLFVCSTHKTIIPEECCRLEFWDSFDQIYFGFLNGEDGDRIAGNLRKFCHHDVKQLSPPEKLNSWVDFFNEGGTVEQFAQILDSAKPLMQPAPSDDLPSNLQLGEFAIEPVNCSGAFAGGYLYYPYRVEKREKERVAHRDGIITESIVTSYLTKVVRSDGDVLNISYLPAPRGTPATERVLALSDGTRIEQMPSPNLYATWHLESIREFIRRRQSGEKVLQRSLQEILTDLEAHFRRSVWLPFEEDYAVVALYAALSFVYNIFEAIPLLIVSGPKGTGKTELGLAFETVSFNARVIGQSSAASAVRIINESRGLIIWDDLEALANSAGKDLFSDIRQMLKLSYKKKTSKKLITARNGQSTIFNFYGPKVINNTCGVDQILGSRMLTVRTARLPVEIRGKIDLTGSDPEHTFSLRNELHIWGMIAAGEIYDRYLALLIAKRGDRQDEILAPLRAIAIHSGDENLLARLERACCREDQDRSNLIEPIVLLREALQKCVSEGFAQEVSLPHIQLQIALLVSQNPYAVRSGDLPFWKQSQWIGTAMDGGSFREKKIPVRRARLYGKETRIYRLREKFVGACFEKMGIDEDLHVKQKPAAPFAFCNGKQCINCEFVNICAETVPGLMPAKNKRLRKFE